eukprot:TRINITY_DN33249_c0_g1_i1.p1 TRINITY_DN33249_c0_g1~~TRINITY_DN33249_c0_g1_i1.p1  ORF type:complete len:636 (+),score=115.54 TRINITY_DN33249_c0_g1_i1:119-1909(+)
MVSTDCSTEKSLTDLFRKDYSFSKLFSMMMPRAATFPSGGETAMTTAAGAVPTMVRRAATSPETVVAPSAGAAPRRVPRLNRHCDNMQAFDLDYYMQDKVLGTGINGDVRQAHCRITGRKVAVKSLSKQGLPKGKLQQLRKEIDIHLDMDHPHIVRLERVYESDLEVKLVMEKLEGGELFDCLQQRSRLEEREVARLMRQCLLAVAYMHGQGYLHRDIKMENLIFTRKGSQDLKLIDFGFATHWDGVNGLSERCGTLCYAAPEVLAGSYTSKCDMWSIGVVAYMLLTGSPPFHGDDQAIRNKLLTGKLDVSRSFLALPRPAQDFVHALLNPNPVERLSAAQALQHPWILACTEPFPAPCPATLQKLVACAQQPLAVRAGLAAAAWCLPAEVEEGFRQQFLALDDDNDGIISLSDLQAAMSKALPQAAASSAESVLASLELEGGISFRALTALGPALEADDSALLATFHRFGPTSAGECSSAQLQKALGEVSRGMSGRELLKALAPNRASLNFPEFCNALRRTGGLPDDQKRCLPALETQQCMRLPAQEGCLVLTPHGGGKGSYGSLSFVLSFVQVCLVWAVVRADVAWKPQCMRLR